MNDNDPDTNTADDSASRIAAIRAREFEHCSDHGCIFGHPGGMGTNGGCRCARNMPTWKLEKQIRLLESDRATLLAALDAKQANIRVNRINIYDLRERISELEAALDEANTKLLHSDRKEIEACYRKMDEQDKRIAELQALIDSPEHQGLLERCDALKAALAKVLPHLERHQPILYDETRELLSGAKASEMLK